MAIIVRLLVVAGHGAISAHRTSERHIPLPGISKLAKPMPKLRGPLHLRHSANATQQFGEGLGDVPGHLHLRKSAKVMKQGHRIFTDIDDTIICSGGQHRGGVDDCRGSGTVAGGLYPGAISFQLALARGQLADGGLSQRPLKGVIPFTARPKELKMLLGMEKGLVGGAGSIRDAYSQQGFKLDLKKAKYGRLWRYLLDSVKPNSKFDKVAERKFRAFKKMYDRDARRVKHSKPIRFGAAHSYFLGDNGQGDLQAAEKMLSYRPSQMGGLTAAFIHDVRKSCDTSCVQQYLQRRIVVFRNYPQAATIAFQSGLITDSSFQAVIQACAQECRGVVCSQMR